MAKTKSPKFLTDIVAIAFIIQCIALALALFGYIEWNIRILIPIVAGLILYMIIATIVNRNK